MSMRTQNNCNTRVFLILCISLIPAFGCSAGAKYRQYDSRIGEKEILTPAPAAAPQINGPTIYGARPERQFVYRIPTQGKRPMKFEAKGLPEGLTLDAANGVITGTTPRQKGEYAIVFSAENSQGKAQRAFKLVVGDKLALTPPAGWNSWGGHMVLITDEIMRQAADVMVQKGLADVGFQYVSIDDCWMKISPENYAARTEFKKKQHEGFSYEGLIGDVRDSEGRILSNGKFPDMKDMTDYIHSYGLKAGLYSSPGPYTCQNFAGSLNYEKQDAAQYAAWGFDLLKYDMCSGRGVLQQKRKDNPEYTQAQFWKSMVDYINQQDRDILFNLCQYGKEDPWKWAPQMGIESWRIGGDLNHHVKDYFEQALRIAGPLREYSKPGQWNDPDFMYIHKIRDHTKMVAPTREIPLTTNQRYQYVTLWSMVCAPFFFSADITQLDDFTVGLLANADIVNVNQDELAHVAEIIRNNEADTVLLKKLAGGSKVLGVFNRTDKEAVIDVSWEELGLEGRQNVRDLWRQKDIGRFADGITVKLSPYGCAALRLEPEKSK